MVLVDGHVHVHGCFDVARVFDAAADNFAGAARALAAKVYPLPAAQRLAAAFLACTSRPATERELALLGELHAEQLRIFKADPEAAKKLLLPGESPAARNLDPAEAAALTVACQAILNLDASVWNR